LIETVVCFDTDVVIKFLISEEPVELREAATTVVRRALNSGRLVAPAFAWAEVGTVLRKKVRQRQTTAELADLLWRTYSELPIDFVDSPALRLRAWQISKQCELPTLYDASFLACIETATAADSASREFWTADERLVRSLGGNRPAYVRLLGVDS
jgi:predicted nucleic acid-binding protein